MRTERERQSALRAANLTKREPCRTGHLRFAKSRRLFACFVGTRMRLLKHHGTAMVCPYTPFLPFIERLGRAACTGVSRTERQRAARPRHASFPSDSLVHPKRLDGDGSFRAATAATAASAAGEPKRGQHCLRRLLRDESRLAGDRREAEEEDSKIPAHTSQQARPRTRWSAQ